MFHKKLILTGLLLAPIGLAIGCGDPCLDDGFVKGDAQCNGQDNPGASDDDDDASGADDDDDGGTGSDTDASSSNTATQSNTGTNSNTSSGTNSNSSSDSTGSSSSDSGTDTTNRWCRDKDRDTFGDPTDCMVFPNDPGGDEWVKDNTDCDDNAPHTFPGAAEFETPNNLCMKDADQDGWGDNMPSTPGVVAGTDCDDENAKTFPGAAANEHQDKCTNDDDGDDWADNDNGGQDDITEGTDCDDSDANTFPGAAEKENAMACMKDSDDDGQGDENPSDPDVIPGSDCDDTQSTTFKGAAPKDDPTACMKDADNDDWGDENPGNPEVTPGTDCLDTDASVFPGAATKEGNKCAKDEDGDEWGDNNPPTGVDPGSDCDDKAADTFPGSSPKDDLNACMKDSDNDDFGDQDNHGQDDVIPGSDCDDNDANVNPDKGNNDCLPPLTLDLPDNYEINSGESQKLEAVAGGGSKQYTWLWTPSTGLSATNVAQPTATPTATRSYTVTLTDKITKQVLTDTVTVHVVNKHVPIGECSPGGIFNIGGFEADTALLQDAEWESRDNNELLCQLHNNQPSGVICTDWRLRNAEVTGHFVTNPDPAENQGTADDDWVGFVWGVQGDKADDEREQYYIFSWKGKDQVNGHGGCASGLALYDGMYVKRIDQSQAELSCHELVAGDSDDGHILLAAPEDWEVVKGTNIATGGWKAGENYTFHLEHTESGSIIEITSQNGASVVRAEIADNTYAEGYFGVFSFSQDNVCYADYDSRPL